MRCAINTGERTIEPVLSVSPCNSHHDIPILKNATLACKSFKVVIRTNSRQFATEATGIGEGSLKNLHCTAQGQPMSLFSTSIDVYAPSESTRDFYAHMASPRLPGRLARCRLHITTDHNTHVASEFLVCMMHFNIPCRLPLAMLSTRPLREQRPYRFYST